MRIPRQAGAIILYGGWLLLSNPKGNYANAPLATWEKVDEFDTAYLCEQKRQEEVVAARKEDKEKESGGARMTATDAELRQRCVRKEQVPEKR